MQLAPTDLSTLLTVLVASLGCTYLLLMLLRRRSTSATMQDRLPPCPARRWPLLGNLPSLEEDPRDQFNMWRREYGDMFSLYVGNTLIVVISGYKMIKEALGNKGAAFTDRPPMLVNEVIGLSDAGVAFSCGAVWREHRAVTTQILKELGWGQHAMATKVQTEARCLVKQLLALKGRATDIQHHIHVAVSNVVCSVVVGRRFEPEDATFQRIIHALLDMFKGMKGAAVVNFFPWLRHLPGDLFKTRRMERAIVAITAMFAEMCAVPGTEKEEKRNHCTEDVIGGTEGEDKAGGVAAHSSVTTDLMGSKDTDGTTTQEETCFISAYRQKRQEKLDVGVSTLMDERNLLKTVVDLFAAGTETTASTISWCLLYTLRTPGVQERLHAELDTVIGRERAPDLTDRPRLPYLEAVIKETQRLASIAPFSLMHMTSLDVELGGHVIPRGTSVLTNLDSVLHDAAIWGKDVHTFNPARFLNSDASSLRRKEEFIPFSIGKRACLGEGLARTEMFLFLAHMFQRFEFHVPDPSFPPSLEGVVGLTVLPRPYTVCCVERSNA